jgi:hypothetical protein
MVGCKNKAQGHKTAMHVIKYEGKFERIVRKKLA